MFEQILIGSCVICGTVIIHVLFINALAQGLTKYGKWIVSPPQQTKYVVTLVVMVLWLVAGLTVSCWLWAFIFQYQGVFETFEASLYFAIVTFTTLGYGDLTPSIEWRLLASLAAVNGLIIVGLNTAFLIEAITRISKAQSEADGE
jgi:hypothetical protein